VNRAELIEQVSLLLDVPKVNVDRVISAIIVATENSLQNGEEVKIAKFGTLAILPRIECRRYNPATREPLLIPKRLSVKFKPSPTLLAKLNK
jgi:nucleoid DNA-binding protein